MVRNTFLGICLLISWHIHITKHYNHYDAIVVKDGKVTTLVEFKTRKAARVQALRFIKE